MTETHKHISANDIAIELIMPEKLMKTLVLKYYEDHDISLSSGLSHRQKLKLDKYIAVKLNVSTHAASLRLYNLGLCYP